MKPFDELSESELASLTGDQIRRYYDYVCAEGGIGFLPDEPVKPAPPVFTPDTQVFNVGSYLHFTDEDEAAKVAQVINGCVSRVDTEWTHIPGGSGYGGASKMGNRPDQLTVSPTKVFSEALYSSIRQDLETAKEAERQYDRDRKEYDKVREARDKATEWMRERIADANDAQYKRERLRNEFHRYLDLADSNREIAWRFLCNAHSDAERMVPELAPPIQAPATIASEEI